ncbi:MAG: YceH family protein [Thermoleophilaceae bacterium]
MEPDAVEIRVVACLVEKQRTTPDQYPLTLNSLRLACNQSTNRDPVVDYDEGTIRSALDRLGRRKWTTLASWSTARSVKYKHVLDQALGLTPGQLSLLAVLMLRGPQTPGELRTRAERMHRFDSNEDLDRTLRELIDRELAAPLPRRPGERGQRYAHLLEGEAAEAAPMDTAPAPTPDRAGPAADGGLGERVDRLEAEVSALRAELHSLREQLGA